MEDVKKRLELNNTSIQIQAAWKLFRDVVRKTPKDADSQQIIVSEAIELKLLWDRCCEGDDVAVKSCCRALVQLVHAGKLDFTSVLSGLLNLVPSARNLSGIVASVGELLVLQIHLETASGGGYTCPYSIRNPPHPFITILTNRPAESWPLLQQEVLTLCQDKPQSVHKHLVCMLVPFLKFVLLEPQQSAQFAPMRNGLQRALLYICRKGPQPIRKQLLDFLANHVGALQISTLENFTSSADFVTSLTDIAMADAEAHEPVLEALSRNLIGLIQWALTKSGWATASLVKALQQVALQCPQVIARSDNLVSLSAQLLQAPLDVMAGLLPVVKTIITQEVLLSPVVLGMVVLPTVQVVSLPSASILDPDLNKSQKLSSEILNTVKVLFQKQKHADKELLVRECLSEGFLVTDALYDNNLYSKLADKFTKDKEALKSWLQNVKLTLGTMRTVPLPLTNLVVGLLLSSDCLEAMTLTLEVIVQIARNDPTQAPNFLAVLLFELGRGGSPEKRLAVLKTIPKVASHKVCVAPVLRTIQMVGKQPKLRPLSLHLMTELWKLQDRCFPHLYSLLVESHTSQPLKGAVDEWLVAKAACMKEVCKARPHQHGADLLSPLSEVLNQCLGVEGGVATALALQGLHALCQAEVIDLKSAWAVLAGSLGSDKRPVVVEQLCELLSLAASADLKIPENEAFLHEAVRRLWRYTQVTNNQISGAAFRSLAAFPVDTFALTMFPPSVTGQFEDEARRQAETLGDEKITMDSLYQYIPGVCFSDLLQAQPSQRIHDFAVLLSSVVRAEICNLPRGIHHSSTRHRGGASNKNKAIVSIPGFLQAQYEQTKQPGLRPALAGSLLFCYDPPLEVGRDGRPRQRHFIARSKSYQQMLTTLLQEVPIQPSEWHRTLTLPATWTAFIGRVFIATLEGRRGELELQTRHGHLHEAEAEDKHAAAWLWARDSLTDVIKAASRGTPSAQANCILALAGLVAVTSRFVAGLPVEDLKKLSAITEHQSHSHWSTVAMDTLMSLMDSNFKPKGQTFGMCKPVGRTASRETPMTGSLARSAVAISLSQVISALLSFDTERIYQMIDMLKAGLTRQPDQSAVFPSHCGLGLGMLLSRLFEEHFSDVGGTRGMTEMWKSLDVLEKCALDTKSYNRSSCLLGLGVALSGLCGEGKTDSRVRVQLLQEKLAAMLDSSSPDEDPFQALCFCVSLVSASAFAANILSMETLSPVLDKLKLFQNNHPENSAVSLSLGMLLHSLSSIGQPGFISANEKFVADWKKKLAQEDTSPLLKVALISGLMAMCGSETTLIQAQGHSASEAKYTHSADVIKMCTQILTGQQDLGIQSASAWSLGHLYQSLSMTTESRTGVPTSYSYLPESSVLRALVDLLLEAGNKGPEKIRPETVEIALASMVEDVVQVLPPVNWTAVISPLMRMNFGTRVKSLCLRLAVAQSSFSPPAAMVITTWLGQSLFASLDDECKLLLYNSLPNLIKTISPTILKKFLLRSCSLPFLDMTISHAHCSAILHGLSVALRVPDPPEAVTAILYETTEHLYSVLSRDLQPTIYAGMCHCLSELPDELVDKIILEDFTDPANHIKGTYIRCHLVAVGRQPIALLNGCIDATMNTPNCDRDSALHMVSHALYQTSLSGSQLSGVVARIQWLLEFLGHSKNIALENIPLRVENKEEILPLAIDFAVQAVSAAISLWGSSVLGGTIGLHPNWFAEVSTSQHVDDKELVKMKLNTTEDFLSMLMGCVTHLEKHPWDQILSQVMDWLWEFSRLPTQKLALGLAKKFKETLLMLRHTADFKKNMTWTKVLGQI